MISFVYKFAFRTVQVIAGLILAGLFLAQPVGTVQAALGDSTCQNIGILDGTETPPQVMTFYVGTSGHPGANTEVSNSGGLMFNYWDDEEAGLPSAGYRACVNKNEPQTMQGWVWNSNVGWMSFACDSTGLNAGAACGSIEYGVKKVDASTFAADSYTAGAAAVLSGFAWGDGIGWVSMGCYDDDGDGVPENYTTGHGAAGASEVSCGDVSYGVKVDAARKLSGFAWSDALGWLSFNGASIIENVFTVSLDDPTTCTGSGCSGPNEGDEDFTSCDGSETITHEFYGRDLYANGEDPYNIQIKLERDGEGMSCADLVGTTYEARFTWTDKVLRVQVDEKGVSYPWPSTDAEWAAYYVDALDTDGATTKPGGADYSFDESGSQVSVIDIASSDFVLAADEVGNVYLVSTKPITSIAPTGNGNTLSLDSIYLAIRNTAGVVLEEDTDASARLYDFEPMISVDAVETRNLAGQWVDTDDGRTSFSGGAVQFREKLAIANIGVSPGKLPKSGDILDLSQVTIGHDFDVEGDEYSLVQADTTGADAEVAPAADGTIGTVVSPSISTADSLTSTTSDLVNVSAGEYVDDVEFTTELAADSETDKTGYIKIFNTELQAKNDTATAPDDAIEVGGISVLSIVSYTTVDGLFVRYLGRGVSTTAQKQAALIVGDVQFEVVNFSASREGFVPVPIGERVTRDTLEPYRRAIAEMVRGRANQLDGGQGMTGDTVNLTIGGNLKNGSVYYYGPSGSTARNVKIAAPIGSTTLDENESKTIIVKGGNLFIGGNILSDAGRLGIIVMSDPSVSGPNGNLYICNTVTDIEANIVVSGSIFPYDCRGDGTIDTGKRNMDIGIPIFDDDGDPATTDNDTITALSSHQLSIKGSVLANLNTYRGSLNKQPIDGLGKPCHSNWTFQCQLYDLNFMRYGEFKRVEGTAYESVCRSIGVTHIFGYGGGYDSVAFSLDRRLSQLAGGVDMYVDFGGECPDNNPNTRGAFNIFFRAAPADMPGFQY